MNSPLFLRQTLEVGQKGPDVDTQVHEFYLVLTLHRLSPHDELFSISNGLASTKAPHLLQAAKRSNSRGYWLA